MSIEAIQNPTFQKAMRIITNITQAEQAEVTTSFAHNYITGMIVRIIVPWTSAWMVAGTIVTGMIQINGQQGVITRVDDTRFLIAIDSTLYDAWATPPDITLPDGTMTQTQFAQAVPVGEVNDILTAATQNVLPYS